MDAGISCVGCGMKKRKPEIEDEIIRRIGEGEPLRQICRDEHMPTYAAVYDWAEDKTGQFAIRFAQARVRGYDAIAAECIEIADDARNDWMERREARDGQPEQVTFNAEHAQRSKLRIETRLKLLAKWDPKRYGERTVVAGDPNAPLTIAAIDLTTATPEQLRAIASLALPDAAD